jgi:Flp pilus assembly protein TadG
MTRNQTSKRLSRRLIKDRRGSTVVEFAIVAPIMIMFLLGIGDQLYNVYATAVLEGAVQKAGRDQTLEVNNSVVGNAALDARVLQLIRGAAPTATATSTRRSYPNFGTVASAEAFTDANGDGDRDTGECYTDINGNGQWDLDPGISGDGNASDAVLYTMTVTYPRIFPAYSFLGGSPMMSIRASTIMKNQPWGDQTVATPRRICT